MKRYQRASQNKESSKTRVLAIALMLRYDRVISGSEIRRRLAAQFGWVVDRKTIYDDMYAINRIMPIEVVTGRHGGYRRIDVLGDCEDGK